MRETLPISHPVNLTSPQKTKIVDNSPQKILVCRKVPRGLNTAAFVLLDTALVLSLHSDHSDSRSNNERRRYYNRINVTKMRMAAEKNVAYYHGFFRHDYWKTFLDEKNTAIIREAPDIML